MSQYEVNRSARGGVTARDRAAVDEGLRAYMLGVYNYMALGLAITGAVALGTFLLAVQSPAFAQVVYGSPLRWVIILAPLALVFFVSYRIDRLSLGAAQGMFWLFAALIGLSLSTIFLVFTGQSIVRVFFVTAAAFGGLSLYGYTTRRDLSPMGAFLFMGLIGIIIAFLVNIFLASTMLHWIASVIGVIVFSGLTAYDTQRIKEMYFAGDSEAVAGRKSIMGALALYLDFINLFMMLMHLFGDRE